jgi:dihydroorotate dehydrogenase
MNLYKSLIKPFMFRMSADQAHEWTIKTSSMVSNWPPVISLIHNMYCYEDAALRQQIHGLTFPNPVGLAAGFDKNGLTIPLMQALGFGFVEIGSITAKPSPGNPKPRSFRLPKDRSIINRMGLNNEGVETVTKRLSKLESLKIPLGINIAKTHDSSIQGDSALEDYRLSFEAVKPIADYITINISCPNTSDGKTFENPESLAELLDLLSVGRDASDPPVFVKISADADRGLLTELLDVCENHSIRGYVAVNTSSGRDHLRSNPEFIRSCGRGGLSGKAIQAKSTEVISFIHEKTKGSKIIIGVGGIFSVEDAIEKLKAGANLLQIYTGLVYEGPELVKTINQGISRVLRKEGKEHIYQLVSG